MLHLSESIFLPASNVSKHKHIVFQRNEVDRNQLDLDTQASSCALLEDRHAESPLGVPELGYQA